MSKHAGAGPHAREPFGQVAVRKGYVTQAQVADALAFQKCLPGKGQPHRLIGLVMLDLGLLGTTELIEILRDLNLTHP